MMQHLGIAFAALLAVSPFVGNILSAQRSASCQVNMKITAFSLLGLSVSSSFSGKHGALTITKLLSASEGFILTDAIHLKYTVIANSALPRTIMATISSGAIPSGTSLQVTSKPAGINQGSGKTIFLNGTAQNLITDIMSCATGSEALDGCALDFIYTIQDPSLQKDGEPMLVFITFSMN